MQPTQSFHSVKAELIASLKSSGKTEINGAEVPSDPDEIELGVPVDRNDLSQGWVEMELPDDDEPIKKSKATNGSSLHQTPQAAGLNDGFMLAFRFESEEGDWDVIMPSYDDEDVPMTS